MVRASRKQAMVACLVAAFGVQTALVYSDERQEPLTGAALRGRGLWHENACQVCHQLYGQGGFLGPDLTNAASRVDASRLGSLLTVGSGQMPALHFSEEQVADMSAYLRALDRPELGRGQLRLGEAEQGGGPWSAFDRVLADARVETPARVLSGYQAFKARPCMACHLPLRDSPVGAPDLSTVMGRLSLREVTDVLTDGRPELGMPPPVPAFQDAERDDVVEFLRWLADGREDLSAQLESSTAGARAIDWRRIPWWEFR